MPTKVDRLADAEESSAATPKSHSRIRGGEVRRIFAADVSWITRLLTLEITVDHPVLVQKGQCDEHFPHDETNMQLFQRLGA